MTRRTFTPLPSRFLPDPQAEQVRREHALAIEELRKVIAELEARIYALENP